MSCKENFGKPRVIALVMGAGLSRRFGSDKRRARLANGRPLLQATLELARTNFDATWVVLRQQDDSGELGLDPAVDVLHAPGSDIGLGTSLGAAFSALLTQASTRNADAAAVMLGDMPWVTPNTCRTLIDHAHAERIAMPRHEGRLGHPVLFGQAYWPMLSLLKGDTGAREVLKQHASACTVVEVHDSGIHRDVDIPMDLD
ncbi:NTP transferase domain-containing protein [Halomonas sp. M20]|uniref:nucleotidyltransferase family protein n=1 Tax=Halomonas sp. M20 TaxID=2763264 RepID=UPI001D09BE18|nr:nucleotidyltransferase family protein [Halomonas sp. M20]